MKVKPFLITLICLAFAGLNFSPAKAVEAEDSNIGSITMEKGEESEDYLNLKTISPWVSGTKFEVTLEEQQVNKTYLVFDYDVTSSINNPELVVKLGLNGTTFAGDDGVSLHGSNQNIQKMYDHWFFLKPGRNALYIPFANHAQGIASFTKFGMYFDTAFAARSGSIEIYGLYLADDYEETLTNNLFAPADFVDNTAAIDIIGLNSNWVIDQTNIGVQSVDLYSDFLGGMKIRVKEASEGGTTIPQPDDYSFVTINLPEVYDISQSDGIAFNVYATSETYFRLVLEDDADHFFIVNAQGGGVDSANYYMFTADGIEGSIAGVYGCLYLTEKQYGVAYIDYSNFTSLGYIFGENKTTIDAITKIKKIHIGFDMLYGLGRSLTINDFVDVKGSSDTLTRLFKCSEFTETEWNINDVNSSKRIEFNNSTVGNNNFVLEKVDETMVPNAKEPVDIGYLSKLLSQVDSLNKNDYTEESWKVLEDALSLANLIKEYPDLYEQKAINECAEDVLQAIRGLKNVESSVEQGCGLSISDISYITTIISFLFICFVSLRKRGIKHEEN